MYNRIMKKILVVDDMHSFREFHKRILEEVFIELEQTEYIIHTADYARDGLNKIYEHSKEPYDTIITDLQMEDDFSPQYAGEWLVEQIKNMPSYYKTRIIIVSGTHNIKQIAESLNVEYVPKRIACTDINTYKDFLIGRKRA